jgi:DDE domain
VRFPSATRPFIKVHGHWHYLYRAIDRDGALVDVMLSACRDLAAAKAFFRAARTVTGVVPDRVTTDGQDTYPAAIRTEVGELVRHRMNVYLNNRLEQDYRGIKDRYRSLRGSRASRQPDDFVVRSMSFGVFCAFDPSITNMSPPLAADCAGSATRSLSSGSSKPPDLDPRAATSPQNSLLAVRGNG